MNDLFKELADIFTGGKAKENSEPKEEVKPVIDEELKVTHIPTQEEMEILDPEGIEVNLDLLKEDMEATQTEDLLQDTFNEDSFDDLNDSDVEIENAE